MTHFPSPSPIFLDESQFSVDTLSLFFGLEFPFILSLTFTSWNITLCQSCVSFFFGVRLMCQLYPLPTFYEFCPPSLPFLDFVVPPPPTLRFFLRSRFFRPFPCPTVSLRIFLRSPFVIFFLLVLSCPGYFSVLRDYDSQIFPSFLASNGLASFRHIFGCVLPPPLSP